MSYFSKILCHDLSMLSKFEGHRIKGLGDMIFQNCHENAKEVGIRQQAATQLRRAATQLRHPAGNGHAAASASHAACVGGGRQAGTGHAAASALRQPCVSPAAKPRKKIK